MSLTRTVPASVPSLFHSSSPLTPSSAREIQRAADGRQARAGYELAAAWVDVLDQDGARLGAVALPQLIAM